MTFHNKLSLCGFVAVLLVVAGIAVPAPAAGSTRQAQDLQVEAQLRGYSHHDRCPRLPANGTGAVGINQLYERGEHPRWYAYVQRDAAPCVIQGLLNNDRSAIEDGMKMLRWTFQRQQPDGSFSGSVRNLNASDYSKHVTLLHETSFFVAAAGRSLLLLEVSPYGAEYANDTYNLKKATRDAAHSMITDPYWDRSVNEHDSQYGHKPYLKAAALGLTAKLTHPDNKLYPALIRGAEQELRLGLSRQQPGGANPEAGGPDTFYHAVGLNYALWWARYLPDNYYSAGVRKMIDRGTGWLVRNIDYPTGRIQTAGNTRVCANEYGVTGKRKEMNPTEAIKAFHTWSSIMPDRTHLQDVARSIDAYTGPACPENPESLPLRPYPGY